MTQKVFLALFITMLSVFGIQAAHADDSTEPVVLTVTGNVANPNRGALDPFDDKVFQYMGIEFDKATTFTLAELRALPQRTIKVRYPDWPREVEATGPSLFDVVKAAEADGSVVSVQAMDGYVFEFTSEDVARDKMILALKADGRALGFGGHGPLWLLGPENSFTDQEGEEGFVFAVVRIDVQ
jgi:hypothetical protein